MTTTEFYIWLSGYLDALSSEWIAEARIKSIKEKMEQVKNPSNQERVIFGPNVNIPPTASTQKGYGPTARK